MLQVGEYDRFEQIYTNRFKSLIASRGQLLGYESDRAALDLGLHLYEQKEGGGDPKLGQVRVWFQLKGIRRSTIGRSQLDAVDAVPVRGLSLQHIQYWAAHPEPVYLAVYIEALDRFLVQDVRDLVERNGGFTWLRKTAEHQRTVTLRMPISAGLEQALDQMPKHRSLRLDGPDFRGRPLGHRLDPLRCELDRLSPEQFEGLVDRLLEVHEFRPAHEVELAPYLRSPIGKVRARSGRLYLTYEWTTPLETEFGVESDSDDFRLEARPISAQGDVVVVIHSEVEGAPRPTDAAASLVEDLQEQGFEQALVFFNAPDLERSVFGGWRNTLQPLAGVPQGLGSLAFNVLTATNVYLEFVEILRWRHVNFR